MWVQVWRTLDEAGGNLSYLPCHSASAITIPPSLFLSLFSFVSPVSRSLSVSLSRSRSRALALSPSLSVRSPWPCGSFKLACLDKECFGWATLRTFYPEAFEAAPTFDSLQGCPRREVSAAEGCNSIETLGDPEPWQRGGGLSATCPQEQKSARPHPRPLRANATEPRDLGNRPPTFDS